VIFVGWIFDNLVLGLSTPWWGSRRDYSVSKITWGFGVGWGLERFLCVGLFWGHNETWLQVCSNNATAP